jgi:hypothetical protein
MSNVPRPNPENRVNPEANNAAIETTAISNVSLDTAHNVQADPHNIPTFESLSVSHVSGFLARVCEPHYSHRFLPV